MAESMTVETILEADWRLQGYWTRLRVPYRSSKSKDGKWGYSDVDLLAYHPVKKHLVIGESKAEGGKSDVFVYSDSAEEIDTDCQKIMAYSYFDFIRKLGQIYKAETIFDTTINDTCDLNELVRSLTVQLVSNLFMTEGVKQRVRLRLQEQVRKDLAISPDTLIEIRIETAVEVFARIVENIGVRDQGKRYGHPVLDLARELRRYSKPDLWPTMRGSMNGDEGSMIRQLLTGTLHKALHVGIENGGDAVK